MKVEELIETKSYKKGGVILPTPYELIQPYLDIASLNCTEFEVKTTGLVENANDDGSVNKAYGRASILGKLKLDNDFSYQLGIVYALDTQKPIIKIFTGLNVNVCTNLTIFNGEHIETANILDDKRPLLYDKLRKYSEEYQKIYGDYSKTIKKMQEVYYDSEEVKRKIGELSLYANKAGSMFGNNTVSLGIKHLLEGDKYKLDTKGGSTGWLMYNAFTDVVTEKSDIIKKADQVLKLSKFFV